MTIAKEIRGKIRSIRNTQKITRAMEMVSASKMRKVQERMWQARPYAEKILQVIGHVAYAHPECKHAFLQIRPVKRAGFIIITTDRGLCGGLNTALLRKTITFMRAGELQAVHPVFSLLGRKAEAFFRRVGGKVLAQQDHLGDSPQLSDLVGIVKVMLDAYRAEDPAERVDVIYVCANRFVNTMQQEPLIQKVLPLEPVADHKKHLTHYWDYIYEPDNAHDLLDKLLTRYIESQVYRAVTENIACEQAARMIAMKNATENANQLINDLGMIYNKARQAAITRELSEIVAGAAAV